MAVQPGARRFQAQRRKLTVGRPDKVENRPVFPVMQAVTAPAQFFRETLLTVNRERCVGQLRRFAPVWVVVCRDFRDMRRFATVDDVHSKGLSELFVLPNRERDASIVDSKLVGFLLVNQRANEGE
eukprot:m.74433 g.74433  ORF g.74433 m.74433 type:complete len:126 (-) comp10299_c0_seq2:1040-1417(-)